MAFCGKGGEWWKRNEIKVEFPLQRETENDGKQPNGLERQPGIPEMMDAHDGKILILRCPNYRQLKIPPCGKGSRVSRHPLNFLPGADRFWGGKRRLFVADTR